MKETISFNDRVGLVIGGTGEIGQAVCFKLASLGASVAVNYFSRKDVAELTVKKISDMGSHAISVQGDIAVSTDVKKIVSVVVKEFKKIDVLVNSAGVNPVAVPVVDLDETTWDRVIDVNLKGPFLCCKMVAPIMIKQNRGRIVNISSIHGRSSPVLRAAYGASKHGLIGLTQTLAKELGAYNITVNAICPGPLDTAMVRDIWAKSAKKMGLTTQEYYENKLSPIPMGRLGSTSDVANLVAFLASDMADYINGSMIDVAGGAT